MLQNQNMTTIYNISSKLNEGPLLRLLETLGMVEIPQVTLPSPPQEENGRGLRQQWKPTPLYVTNTETKNPKYHGLNDILKVTLTIVYVNHVKSTSSKIFKAILCQNPEFKPNHGFKVPPHPC